jgi:hypothetical protein
MHSLKKIIEKIDIASIFVVLVGLLFLYISESGALRDRIYHDLSSYLAPAVSLSEKNGLPYINYFDIKPPALIFLLLPWIYIFGYCLKSLVFLDVALNTLLIFLFYKIMKKLAGSLITYIYFVYGLIAAISMEQFQMMLMSETIGLLFIFGCFYFLLRNGKINWHLAGLFLAIASQVKEVYLFPICSVIIHILVTERSKIRKIINLILGWVFGIAFIIFILIYTKTLGAYFDVLSFKSEIFHFPTIASTLKMLIKIFIKFQPTSWVFVLAPLIMYQKNKKLIYQLKELYLFKEKKLFLILLLFASMILNFTYQGKDPSGHYLVSIWFIYIICLAGLVTFYKSCFDNKNNLFYLNKKIIQATALLFGLFTLYKISYDLNNSYDNLNFLPPKNLESKQVLDKYITAKKFLKNGDCIQQPYGWDAGASYIYTGTKPCSKYFLSNLIANEKMKNENKREIINSPPRVIIYSKAGANLDTADFEVNIFPWGQVIDKCYIKTNNPEIFVSKMGTEDRRICILNQLN